MDWSTVWSLVLGGAISLISSVTVLGIGLQIETARKRREQKKLSALEAYSGLVKLSSTMNAIENLAYSLDLAFSRLGADGSDLDPAAKVRPIIGHSYLVELVAPHEMLFLANGDGELMARIGEIQVRVQNDLSVIAEYNMLRREFDAFLESYGKIELHEGTAASFELTREDGVRSEMKIASLNSILGSLIEAVDEDRKALVEVIKEYIGEARRAFGDDFPAKNFEIRERKRQDFA